MENIERFCYWINERHSIYQRRLSGAPPPWTDDPILQEYKFTNPFRENDRVTVWMRQNWTKPNSNRSHGEMIFNCCLFRMVGTSEFAEAHGWVEEFNPEYTKSLIEERLKQGLRTFTGAYIITNQGLKAPKSEVVVDHFLSPVWENKEALAQIAAETQSLEKVHEALAAYKGWGGGGFMSYEVVTDLNYTPVLARAEDKYKWANAGPGAKRGLNRIHDRPLKKALGAYQSNREMQDLLEDSHRYLGKHISILDVDMRCIEHSLCEWDKYERVRLGQGRPRSIYRPTLLTDTPKGAVE